MNSAIERLITLRVKDVMRRELITVRRDATMAEAAALLDRHEITGVPVVDEQGVCVGMLSSTDFVQKEMAAAEQSGGAANRFESTSAPKGFIAPAPLEGSLVEAHMSQVIQAVGYETPILNAARVMCDEHIHRLLAVDEDERPVGILSSLDLVACMVAAVEE